MSKKLLLISILAVFMLLAISLASAVNTSTPVKKKESPLFGIRTRQAIKERIGDIIENIKTKYIGERVFFLPFQWLRLKNIFHLYTGGSQPECDYTEGTHCTRLDCTDDVECTELCKIPP